MKRRTYLSSLGAGIVTLSGCTALAKTEREWPRLEQITIENHDNNVHTIQLFIERGGKRVYWQSQEVAAGTYENGELATPTRRTVDSEGTMPSDDTLWGGDTSPLKIHIRLDDSSRAELVSLERGDMVENLLIRIEETGEFSVFQPTLVSTES